MKSNIAYTILLSSISEANSKCPFGFGGSTTKHPKVGVANIVYPNEYFVCSGGAKDQTTSLTQLDYFKIASAIVNQFEALTDSVADNSNVRANYAGCLVRLVGHDFMDFRIGSANGGGADGCINFNDGDNLGLKECIQNFDLQSIYS